MAEKPVTEYIALQPEPQKSEIKRVYDIARRVAKNVEVSVEEGVSYAMPCLTYRGKSLISVMNTKKHIGIYPYSGFATSELGDKLKNYDTSPGTIRFTPDNPLPEKLLEELVATRIMEIEDKLKKS